ncbi:MAG: YabP/YqfC family sporulation protein [Thermoflexaceae bacterium]|nr:YabP/YqfC family sporulation protein [Thermoflexaceae bacterium]
MKNSSIINIMGNNSLLIENFKAIMEYKNDFVRIKAKDKIISIHGSKLAIEYYNAEEIKIIGKINSIFFEVINS